VALALAGLLLASQHCGGPLIDGVNFLLVALLAAVGVRAGSPSDVPRRTPFQGGHDLLEPVGPGVGSPIMLREAVPASSGTGRRLLTNSFYVLLAEGASKAIAVALFLVMVRRLGPAAYGIFAFAIAWSALIMTVGHFGLDQILTRQVAPAPERLHEYFANTLAIKAMVAVPTVLVALTVVALTSSSTTAQTSFWVFMGALAELVTSTSVASYQAFERLEFVPIVRIVQRFLIALVGILVLLRGGGVVAIAAIYAGGSCFAAVLSLFLLQRIALIRFTLTPSTWLTLIRLSLPVGVAGVLASALFRLDILLLALFASSAIVGEYGAAYRLLDTTVFISFAVGAAAYPVFCKLTPDSEPSVGWVFKMSLKLLLAITLPIGVAIEVLAATIVRTFFGVGYADSVGALQLLAPTVVLFPVVLLTGYLLIGRNHAVAVTKIYAVGTAVNLALNIVLIPALSLYGAALTTSVCELGLSAALLVAARSETRGASWTRVLLGPAAASAAMGVLLWLMRAHLLAAVVAGGSLYLVALLTIERLVFPGELVALRRSVGLRRSAA
jgi:O-antigen/teichoic acid export membrane protein